MPANSVIQLRRGTAAQWTSANPVLAAGEPGYETDTGKEKRGDGATAWVSLPYFTPGNGTFEPAGTASAAVATAGQVVAETHQTATVQNSTGTEANLVAFSLPSDLAPGDVYEFRAEGGIAHTLSSPVNIILRFRLGSTYAMISPTITLPGGISDPRRYTLRVTMHIGDAGAARMYGELRVGDPSPSQSWNPTTISITGTASAASIAAGATVAFTGQVFTGFGYINAFSAVLRRIGRAAAVSHLFNGATRTVNSIPFALGSPSKPWNATTRGGNTVDRFEIRSGDFQAADTSAKERVEWGQNTTGLFAPGQDIWVAYAMKIEAGATSTAAYCVLGQLHQTSDAGDLPNLSPSVGLTLAGADLLCTTISDPAATTTVYPTAVTRWTIAGIARDAWHYFVHHMVIDPTGAAGVLESWHNGTSLYSNTAIPLGYNDTLGHFWKHGIYRAASPETIAVQYANFEIGSASLAARVSSPLTIVSP